MKRKKLIKAMMFCVCAMVWALSLSMFSGIVEASTANNNGALLESNPSDSGENDTQSAQSTVITGIELTVEIPKVGSENNTVIFSVPEDAGYTVTVEGENKWVDTEAGSIANNFQPDRIYRVNFSAKPKDGYTWGSSVSVPITVNSIYLEDAVLTQTNDILFEYNCRAEVLGTIWEICLEDVPTTAAAGEIAGSYSYTEPYGQYTVTGIWHCYNADTQTYEKMSAEDQFESGKIYELHLKVNVAEGYWLDGACTMFVNGNSIDVYNNERITVEGCIPAVSLASEVSMVQIPADAIPKAELGAAFQDSSIPVSVTEESGVTVLGRWIYRDDQGEHRSGTFESGKSYYFQMEAVPKAGYFLSNVFEFWVGENEILPYEYSATMAKADIRVSFAKEIHEIELLDLPVASLGDILQTGTFQVTVPADAGYTAEAKWDYFFTDPATSIDSSMPVDSANGTNVVQSGRNYLLRVYITPVNGYEFSESVQVKAYGVWHQQDHVVPELPVEFTKTFSFRQLITDVEITAEMPEIGPVSSVSEPTVPSDAHYTISGVHWLDVDDYNPASVFEAGHEYELQVTIAAKEGYEFQRETSVVFNGKKVESVDLPSPDNPTKLMAVLRIVSFKETLNLTEIRLDNVPTMKVGERASTDITISQGSPYVTAFVGWSVWDDNREIFEPFSGIFEDGKIYRLEINCEVASEYRIDADNIRYFFDGVEHEVDDKGDWGFLYMKEFSSSLTPIERIELEIEAPVSGNHSSLKPVVLLPSGVNYRLSEYSCWVKGDLDNFWEINEEYFEEDGSYGVYVELFANEGYRFSENPIVLVNGTVPPEGSVEFRQGLSSIHFFFRYKSAVEVHEDFKDSDISQELKAAGFDTVSKIDEHLKTAMHMLNSSLDNTVLYDVVLMYSADGGVTWHKADEDHFPSDGKLMVSLKVPEGTNHEDYHFTVLHMFSSSAFGKIPGDWEQPEVTKRTDADGVEYLDFYVTGLSPVMVGWSKENTVFQEPQQPDYNIPESKDPEIFVTPPATGDELGSYWKWGIISVFAALTAAGMALLRRKI